MSVELADLMENLDETCSRLCIDDLPPELLIHLFSFLDGLSLIRLSCLSKKFLDITSAIWQPVFERELTESVLDVAPGVYKGLHRPQHFYSPSVPWKKLFTSVMVWQSIKKWDVAVTLTEVMTGDEISCFGVAGNETVWGTKRGLILKMSKDDLSDWEGITEHGSKINSLVVQVSSENDYDDDDEELRYRIVTLSEDRSIHINDLDFGHSMKNIVKFENIVGIQDSLYEWSAMSDVIFDLKFDIHKKTHSRARLDVRLPTSSCYGRVIAVDPYQIIITHRAGPLTWDPILENWRAASKVKSIRVQRGYIFPQAISVCITTDYNMIVTVEMEDVLIKWPVLMRPTSVLLHGRVFIVGTETGHLVLYFLKSRRDILKLSPDLFDAKFDTDQSDSILHIAISEPDEDHPYPDIFAASRHQIICIRTLGLKK